MPSSDTTSALRNNEKPASGLPAETAASLATPTNYRANTIYPSEWTRTAIRRWRAIHPGLSYRQIGARFGVSGLTAYRVLMGLQVSQTQVVECRGTRASWQSQ